MAVTERLENGRVNASSRTGLHLKKQLSSAGAGDVKGLVADLVAALYAGSHPLLADVAHQAPAISRNLFNILDRLHVSGVGNRDFGYPDCAQQMRPPERVGLLEGALNIWTKDTCRGSAANLLALPTEPLAFGDERNTIALLMHGEVAAVAEDDGVGILTVAFVADGALAVGLIPA